MSSKPLQTVPTSVSFLSNRVRRLMVLVVGLVTIGCLFTVAVIGLQKAEEGSTGSKGNRPATEDPDALRNIRLLRQESTDVTSRAMLELVLLSDKAHEDLNEFERLAGVYRKQFEELKDSTKGGPLVTEQGVVRYFMERWSTRLPEVRMAGYWRTSLHTLMRTVNLALQEEGPGYLPGQTLVDEIKLLATKADGARKTYAEHQRLLDALARKIGEGPQADPNTIKAEVLKLEDETVLKHLLSPSRSEAESRGSGSQFSPKNESLRLPGSRRPGSIDDLQEEDLRRREAAQRANSGKIMLRETTGKAGETP